MNTKIIDFCRKGNMIRFYLGEDECTDYWGDDWDDAPYEHNAGSVYREFVKGTKDIAFPFDSLVLEPCNGVGNSKFSKEDMKNRLCPCIIVIPEEVHSESWHDDFAYWVGCDKAAKYYFNDLMEVDK